MRVIGKSLKELMEFYSRFDDNNVATIKELGRGNGKTGIRIGWVEEEWSSRKFEYVKYKKAAWLLFQDDGRCCGHRSTKRAILAALGVTSDTISSKPSRTIHSPKAKSFDDNLKQHPLFRTDRGNCGVRAFANIAQTDYATSREQCMKHGYKPRGGGMYTHRLKIALKEFGVQFEDRTKIITDGYKTIKSFERANIKGRWLIVTSGHFISVIDGTVTDWSAERNLRIVTAYKVI